uniref:AP2/ERF domain-containing protein n=1 Tax=Oryza punctata TaxID=4537 RepID=A0A0E0LVJ2_ORYPU
MDHIGISSGGGGEGGVAPMQPSSPERRYKGVRLRKWGRWVSEIRMPNSRERIWLGSYESAEKAARAFDAAAVCLRGSRGAGSLNFPESPPDVRHFPGALLTVEQIQAEAARHANRPYPGAATAAANTTAGAAGSSSYSQQQATAPARSTSNDTAMSGPSTDGGAADYGGGDDDVIDWSFMDALPAMSASSPASTNAELVPAMDDFMYGFLHTMPPCEDGGEEDVMIDGNMDQTFFSVDLWRF